MLRWALVCALLLGMTAAGVAPSASAAAPAQQGPGVNLVNADREFVERRGDGFVARPIFNHQPEHLFFGVKDPVDGSWIAGLYRVVSSSQRVSEGWEYTMEYPTLDEQPKLDPDRAYTLALFASLQGELSTFEAAIPIEEPGNLWDRVLDAFNPANWARSFARWVVEGAHGLVCSVLGRITGSSLENCRS